MRQLSGLAPVRDPPEAGPGRRISMGHERGARYVRATAVQRLAAGEISRLTIGIRCGVVTT